jgi:nucleoid-associated protein YgaU
MTTAFEVYEEYRLMPIKPDSRFAQLPMLEVKAPDGSRRQVIALRLVRSLPEGKVAQHLTKQSESIDLLARRFYGSERLWWRILDANPVLYPLDIRPGDVLNVPASGPATRVTRARKF